MLQTSAPAATKAFGNGKRWCGFTGNQKSAGWFMVPVWPGFCDFVVFMFLVFGRSFVAMAAVWSFMVAYCCSLSVCSSLSAIWPGHIVLFTEAVGTLRSLWTAAWYLDVSKRYRGPQDQLEWRNLVSNVSTNAEWKKKQLILRQVDYTARS